MKTALITGITGQDGAYLSQFLLSKGYKVIGIIRKDKKPKLKSLQYLGIVKDISFEAINLLELSDLINLFKKQEVNEIYNLAAQSSVGLSFNEPVKTIEFNIMSTINLLEAIRKTDKKIRFYQASSSEMYGNINIKKLPVDENTNFSPISPYGISKVTSHFITKNYREIYDIYAVCGIAFNHESPLRRCQFIAKKIINTAVKIWMGEKRELNLGNLDIYRDWGYAPNYIEAIWLMLQQEKPNDFIISSGEAHNLKEFVAEVFNELKLDYKKFLKIDKKYFRPKDIKIIYGDNTKIKKHLNWNNKYTFKILISKLVQEEKKFIEWEKYTQ